MKIIKVKKPRISTILTTLDPGLSAPVETQVKAITSMASSVAKCHVDGPISPPVLFGLKYTQTQGPAKFVHALRNYQFTFPGNEVCMLLEPTVIVNKDKIQALLEFVSKERVMLTWGAEVEGGFVFTSQVLAHLTNDIKELRFIDDWRPFVKQWAQGMLRHRFFPASIYGITSPVPVAAPKPAPEPEVVAPVPQEEAKKAPAPAKPKAPLKVVNQLPKGPKPPPHKQEPSMSLTEPVKLNLPKKPKAAPAPEKEEVDQAI